MKREYPSFFDPGKSVTVWFCDQSCCNGKEFHREGAWPAVIYPDGTKEWWKHGKKLTDEELTALRNELFTESLLVKPQQRDYLERQSTDLVSSVRRPAGVVRNPWYPPKPLRFKKSKG